MIGDGPGDAILLAVCGAFVLASVVGLLRGSRPCLLLSRVRALLTSARERMASYNEASTDEVGMLVQARLRQLKVDHIRWFFRGYCMGMTPMAAGFMYKLIWSLPRHQTFAQEGVFVLMFGLSALVLNCPRALSWKTIDVFVGAFTLGLVVYASPWFCNPERANLTVLATIALTIILNIVRRSVLVAVVSNSAIAAAIMGTAIVHGQDVFMNRVLYAAVELLVLAVFPAFAYTLDVSIDGRIRKSLEMQVAKEVLSAASALLRTCCDVVVELDAEGTILSTAQELGGFLLRGPGRCFKGLKLPQLFSLEEDREKFLQKLSAAEPSGQGLAEAIHVRMKDGNDELLRVELLWFGFRHLDGPRRFMVGLREFSDFTPKAKRRLRRRRPRAEAGEGESADASGRRGEGEDHDRQPGSESSESRATSGSTTSMEVQVASLTVDATQEGLPVRACSPGFRSRIGRLHLGSSLAEHVRHEDCFVQWVQTAINAASGGGEVPDSQVTLEMRQGRLQAICRLMVDSEEEPPDLDRVELVFFNVRPCRGRSGGRRGHSGDGGSGTSSQSRGTPVARMSL